MTTAALIVVTFGNPSVDLTWASASATNVVVCNDGQQPDVVANGAVNLLTPPRNLGFGAAVNLAASTSTGDRLVVVNPDCHLNSEHWDALTQAEDHEVVVVPLVEPSGAATIVASRYPGRVRFVLSALRARERVARVPGLKVKRPPQQGGSFSLTTHWFSGAAFSISRSRFEEVGGFDEGYFLYWEDADLSRRLAEVDDRMRVRVAETTPATHGVGGSNNSPRAVALERLMSAARFASSNPQGGWRSIARWLELASLRQHGRPQRPPRVDVGVVSLGRTSANGERRRVRSWLRIAEAAGMSAAEFAPPGLSLRGMLRPGLGRDLLLLARGEIVPEALAVNPLAIAVQLRANGVTTLVCVTARAYHPGFCSLGARVVLDYVDRLSDSYSDRAQSLDVGRPTAAGLRLLAWSHRRFEGRRHPSSIACATGRSDATSLGVEYLPIVSEPAVSESSSPSADLIFVGTLDYPPNVEAVRYLARIWPQLQSQRPGTTLIVAGSRPRTVVVEFAKACGWDLLPDFLDPATVYGRARVAVAPVTLASGMQIKIQDAISFGLPMVSTSLALAGYDEDVPAVRADTEESFVAECIALLEDEQRRAEVARRGREWLGRTLAPSRFTHVLRPD